MSALGRRLRKLEAGRRKHRIIYVPDHVQGLERVTYVEDYRREHNLSPGDWIIALDERDRGA